MRLLPALLGAVVLHGQEPVRVFQPGAVEVDGVTFPFQLLRPEGTAPKPAPLVVFLHGAGERGTDNQSQLRWFCRAMAEPEARRRHPCFVLAVQCPPDRMWVEVAWAEQQSRPMAAQPSLPMRAVLAAMAKVEREQAVDPTRIYLTGLSMGGYGAWDLAMREPLRFAALLPVCGGGDERQAHRLLGLPIWTWHGDRDPAVPVQRSRRMVAALQALGHPVQYSELPGVGHDSWVQAYGRDGALDWLFAQSAPTARELGYPVLGAVRNEPRAEGAFAVRVGMRVVAPGAAATLGRELAAELTRALGGPVAVVADESRDGDVVLAPGEGSAAEATLAIGARVTIAAATPAGLGCGAGAFLQALGAFAGLAAPHGDLTVAPDSAAGVLLEVGPKAPSAGVVDAVLRRCWLFGIGRLVLAGGVDDAIAARGAALGVTVTGAEVATPSGMRMLRIPADDPALANALSVGIAMHRAHPVDDTQRLLAQQQLARAARVVGW